MLVASEFGNFKFFAIYYNHKFYLHHFETNAIPEIIHLNKVIEPVRKMDLI
jgi:hypothetical protein